MKRVTPEQAGISSRHVLAFYKELAQRQLSTHAVILSRGDTEGAFADRIRGRVFDCEESATGIKWFRLDIQGDGGSFPYENARGESTVSVLFEKKAEHFPDEYQGIVNAVARN